MDYQPISSPGAFGPEMSKTISNKQKNRRSFQSNITTRSAKHQRFNNKDDTVFDFQSTFGKRRTSLPAQVTVHPATRLASVARRMETSHALSSKKTGHTEELKTAMSSKASDITFDTTQPKVSKAEEQSKHAASKKTHLQSSIPKVSNPRTFRPHYPRTPTPKSALLLDPKPSAAKKYMHNSDIKAFTSVATKVSDISKVPCSNPTTAGAPKLRPHNGMKGSPCKPGTPKMPKTQTPKSNHRMTPKCLKGMESFTPRSPRAGTPKRTPKSQKMEQSFICEICDDTLTDKKAVLRHQRHHKRGKTDGTISTPTKAALKRTPKSRKNPHAKFECDICSKTFRFRSNLKCHEALHNDERTFGCKICQKTLLSIRSQNGSLVIKRTELNNEQHEICDRCCHGKKCFEESEKHRRAKAFMCEKCARTFVSESNLRIHMKIHTIDKIRDILRTTSSRFAGE